VKRSGNNKRSMAADKTSAAFTSPKFLFSFKLLFFFEWLRRDLLAGELVGSNRLNKTKNALLGQHRLDGQTSPIEIFLALIRILSKTLCSPKIFLTSPCSSYSIRQNPLFSLIQQRNLSQPCRPTSERTFLALCHSDESRKRRGGICFFPPA
jgi:hypothetical protein